MLHGRRLYAAGSRWGLLFTYPPAAAFLAVRDRRVRAARDAWRQQHDLDGIAITGMLAAAAGAS